MDFKTWIRVLLICVTVLYSLKLKAQYCESSASNGDFEYISRVTLGSIDNQSGSNLYTDYSEAISTNVYTGVSYLLTIKTEEYFVVDNIGCWIDWNQNEIFEMDESIELNIAEIKGKQATIKGEVTPPTGARNGKHRMRILLVSDKTPESCLNFTYGEVEDYSIIVHEFVSNFAND